MTNKKTVLIVALMTISLFFLSGCGQETSPSPIREGAALKIVIITGPSGVDDDGFNQDNYNGILNFIAQNPASTVEPIQETREDSATVLRTVEKAAADYDVLVCAGYQFAPIGSIAEKVPAKKFILVDTYPTDESGKELELENVYAMQFAEQESGFFAGMAAALETKTGKVAVVNGIAYPPNVNYQYGFECGVKYVNATEGLAVESIELPSRAGTDVAGVNVGGNYIGSFMDRETGREIGQELIGAGCDILFAAAGASGQGVLAAVQESGTAMAIGCDADQYDNGKNGDTNIILTTAVKKMGLNVERQLAAIADGTFKGSNVLLKADTDSTGYIKEEGRHQLSGETVKKLEAAYVKIQKGEIVPASSDGGFLPEEFEAEGVRE